MIKEELLQIPFYIEDISGSTNTVSISKKYFDSAPTLNLEYSTDGSTWTTKTMNSNTTPNTFTLPANGKIYFRGVNNNGWCSNSEYFNTITCSGQHNVGGNSMSLLYGSNFIGKTSFPTNNNKVFAYLFYANTNLVNAQDLLLPATTLVTSSYYKMFNGCSSLTTVPELSATTLAYFCYHYMFADCTSLTTAPELPATTLANYCYSSMFRGCSSLTTAPSILPATTLAVECYENMFYNCSSLTTAPELPATTLATSCYSYMFYGTNLLPDCSNIDFTSETVVKSGGLRCLFGGTKVTDEDLMEILPINPSTGHYYLPVTTLAESCYSYMFDGCSSLTTAPELPATTLIKRCYHGMFYNCNSLTTAPSILPATTLAESCYENMFVNCSSLTTAPELPATTLVNQCYSGMFYNCSSLNYIKADFINYDSNYLYSWVYGVSSTGTFVMNPNANYNPHNIRGEYGIPTGWNVVRKRYTDTHVYIVNQSKNLNSLIINNNSSDLQYLVDMTTKWVTLPTSKESQRIEFKDGITLKGNNTSLNGCRIKTSNDSTLNGNIMALLYGDDYEDKVAFPEGSENTFKYLFLGYDKCLNITNLLLPATTLVPHCYHHMFTGCSSLKSITKLPVIDLTDYCYHGMFMDCDSIDKATLSAQYLAPYAYSNMFLGSDNLSDVTVTYKDDVDETNYKGWLKGVTTNGKFTYNHTEEVDSSIIKINYHVPVSWDIKYFDPNAINYFYIEDISGEENTVCITNRMGLIDEIAWGNIIEESLRPYMPINLEYSYDKITWESVIFPELTTDESSWYAQVPLPKNGIVYFRNLDTYCNPTLQIISELGITLEGDNYFNTVDNFSYLFAYSINVIKDGNIGGDIRTLSNGMDIENTPNNDIYYSLFASIWVYNHLFIENKIMSAENLQLPATTLVPHCYQYMFSNCSSLVKAPELPAITLANSCYHGMFSSCKTLTTAPELPATTLADSCYSSMFSDCTSLTTAPELPATTLADSCYYSMFQSCTSLTTAPSVLPATTLADYCYQYMFNSCYSLTTAPELSAITLADYCYQYMFTSCGSLNYIKADFINYSNTNGKFTKWVDGVSSTGTFVMNPNANYNPDNIRGFNGIPHGWTVLTSEE